MVKDVKTGECFRADHLIEGKLSKKNIILCFVKLSIRIAHLEKLLKAKDITAEKKTEIERLLPQVNHKIYFRYFNFRFNI